MTGLTAAAVLVVAPFAGSANAQGPSIDGVYSLGESDVQGSSCPPTPFRAKLAPGTSSGVNYEVAVTAAGGQVTFASTGGEVIFTATVTEITENPFRVEFRDSRAQDAPSGYLSVDGSFEENLDDMLVFIEWWRETSPGNGDLCRTDFGGRRTRASVGATSATVARGVPVELVLALGGAGVIIATVTIGGWRWTNRRRQPLADKSGRLAPRVPPECAAIAIRHDTEVEILASLRAAAPELRQKLERAETIHRNNIIKVAMTATLELVLTATSVGTDAALALRPSVLRRVGSSAVGQSDSWTPPGSISRRLAAQIRWAEGLASEAWAAVNALRNKVETLKGAVFEAVEQSSAVRNARQLADFHANRLGQMIEDLPRAKELRGRLSEIDAAREALSPQLDALHQAVEPLKQRIADADSALEQASRVAKSRDGHLVEALQKAEADVAALLGRRERTIDKRARASDTLRKASAPEPVEQGWGAIDAQDRVDLIREQLRDLQADPQYRAAMEAVRQAREKIADATAQLEPLNRRIDSLARESAKLTARRQRTHNELVTQYNDLTPGHIEAQGRMLAQANGDVDRAVADVRRQAGAELLEREAELERKTKAARTADALVADLRLQAQRADSMPRRIGSAIGSGLMWVTTPVRYPFTLLGRAWDWAFGSGQSPQEVAEIMLRNQRNVQILRSYLESLERRIDEQQQRVNLLGQQVSDCVKGRVGRRVSSPVQSPARMP